MTSVHYYIAAWASLILAQASFFHGDMLFAYLWGGLALVDLIFAYVKLDK